MGTVNATFPKFRRTIKKIPTRHFQWFFKENVKSSTLPGNKVQEIWKKIIGGIWYDILFQRGQTG